MNVQSLFYDKGMVESGKMKNVTKRVAKHADLNSQKTYLFCNATSTAQEKILAVRAKIL